MIEFLLIVGAFLLLLTAGGLWARGYDRDRADAWRRNHARPRR